MEAKYPEADFGEYFHFRLPPSPRSPFDRRSISGKAFPFG